MRFRITTLETVEVETYYEVCDPTVVKEIIDGELDFAYAAADDRIQYEFDKTVDHLEITDKHIELLDDTDTVIWDRRMS